MKFSMFPVKRSLNTCLFVYGSAGTGKTLILMEALKIKLCKLLCQGRTVRILATTFDDDNIELRNYFSCKYLVNMKNIEVMSLSKLCRDLNVTFDPTTPRDTINRVIVALSDKYSDIHYTDVVTLLLVDEVRPCSNNQTAPDWRDLEVRENVIWFLAVSPIAPHASSTELLPPVKGGVLTRHLIHKYRNCSQIRK